MPTDGKCPLEIGWESRPRSLQPRLIQSYSIDTGYLTSTDEWSVVLYDTDKARLRNMQLEPITLSVFGVPQLIGWVEKISRGADGSVRISGRDYMSQLVECNVDPTVAIKESDTLEQAIKAVAGPCGITKVTGDGSALRNTRTGVSTGGGAPPDFLSLKPGELKPTPGQGVYEFLNRIAARHGATLQPGLSRSEIVVTAPNYSSKPVYTLRRTDDPNRQRSNNVIAASSDEDWSRAPTVGLVSGQITKPGEAAQPKSFDWDMIAELQVNGGDALAATVSSKVVHTRIKPGGAGPGNKVYRLIYFKDTESRNVSQLHKAIQRAICERLKDSLSYQATVIGHQDPKTGAVYSVDTIASVSDDVCDIHENLWIASRRLTYEQDAGPQTQLELIRPGSFVL